MHAPSTVPLPPPGTCDKTSSNAGRFGGNRKKVARGAGRGRGDPSSAKATGAHSAERRRASCTPFVMSAHRSVVARVDSRDSLRLWSLRVGAFIRWHMYGRACSVLIFSSMYIFFPFCLSFFLASMCVCLLQTFLHPYPPLPPGRKRTARDNGGRGRDRDPITNRPNNMKHQRNSPATIYIHTK